MALQQKLRAEKQALAEAKTKAGQKGPMGNDTFNYLFCL